jgi:hypothetical protein
MNHGAINIGNQFNLPVLATFDNLNASIRPLSFADLFPELMDAYGPMNSYDKINWKELFDKIDDVMAKLRESSEYVPILASPPSPPPRFRYCESCDGTSEDADEDGDADNGASDDEDGDNGAPQLDATIRLVSETTPDPDPDFVNFSFDYEELIIRDFYFGTNEEHRVTISFDMSRQNDWNFENLSSNPNMERMFHPYEKILRADANFLEKFNKANDFEKYRLVAEFICQETEKVQPRYRFKEMVLRPEYRQRLSEERAKALYPDLLIYAYAPPRLPYSWNEDAESLFYDDYIAECRKWRDHEIINPDRLPFDDVKYAKDLASFVATYSHTLVKITKNAAVALEDDLD